MAHLSPEQKMIIAYNLYKLRTGKFGERGSGKKCAEKTGIPQSQWSAWENGARAPSMHRQLEVAKFFDIKPEDLLRPPENWDEIRVVWGAGKFGLDDSARMKKLGDASSLNGNGATPGNTPGDETPVQNATSAQAPDGQWVATDQEDFTTIVSLLANSMKKVAAGELDNRTYNEKMRQILQYVKFTIAAE